MSFIKKSKTIIPVLLLIITTVFYYIPSLVYFPNRADFDNYFINLITPILLYVAIAGLVIWLTLSLLPKPILKYITAVLMALALLLWLQGGGFAVSYGLLDGSIFDFSRFSQRGKHELWVLSVAIILALIFQKFVNKQLPFILLLISIGQIVLVTYNVITEPNDKELAKEIDLEFYNYSPKKNVILIILDTFGADYFKAIRELNPKITDDYKGFVNYTDAISNYPATKGSLPSLLTGKMIPEDKKYRYFLQNEIIKTGLPTMFENKGYLVSVVSVYRWFKSFYKKRYIYHPPVDLDVLKQFSGYKLLDLALFRVSPHVLKPYIYKDGSWLLSGSLASQTELPNMLPEKGETMLRIMTKKATLGDDTKRFKIIHVSFPHPQLIFDKDCRRVSLEGDSKDLMIQQSSCALKRLTEILDKFKDLGIYDSSLIAVVSDHGSRIVTDKKIHGFPSYFEMESSRILFMIKGINQHAPFSDIDTPVSLINLYDMFMDERKHNKSIDYLEDNNRLFFSFRNQDNSGTGYLPDSPLFKVSKNAESPKSWKLMRIVTHDCPAEKIPMTVKITKDGREKYCAKFGFATPRTNGTGAWTESNDVRMIFKLDLSNKVSLDTLSFSVKFKPFINVRKKQLDVEWYVNNQLIHSQQLNNKETTQTILKAPIELIKSKELTELQVKFSGLASPKNLGINSDSRKLGLFISSIEVE
ncbi:hypothetical protein MNBD_GAMMA01-404 [hydrothermal vent metagenome]|uniref:Sulfatase N-terminal domain-containing protein n=1 Tax=hydrothermal vent metagenome TaxID=652676 RepID=A0A3B0VLQ7_9ZZZZ